MEGNTQQTCLICLQPNADYSILPQCQHTFCNQCLKGYIDTLKRYKLLTPQKLVCLQQGCKHQLPDQIIKNLYPGEEGFILTVQIVEGSFNKNIQLQRFHKIKSSTVSLKPADMDRDLHSKLMNQRLKLIHSGAVQQQDKKICTNILSYNQYNTKQTKLQCYVCGASYCPQCGDFSHLPTKCQINKNSSQQLSTDLGKFSNNSTSTSQNQNTQNQDMDAYLLANSITKCLNPKCGMPIAKEQGCFWVKCRCSWQLCYPCKKVWGDCQHFSKYPYKKFVPPPEWMIKALNLY